MSIPGEWVVWLGGLLAGLGGLLGLYVRGRLDGRRAEERRVLEARVRTMEERRHAEQDAEQVVDPRDVLARDWRRGGVR